MWLTRVFLDLANRDERSCLTINCTTVNKNGPSRYRTKADNPVEQFCYFNEPGSNQVYNIFIKIDHVQRRKTLEKNGSGNYRLLESNRESTNDSRDGDGRETGSTKIFKYLLHARESA